MRRSMLTPRLVRGGEIFDADDFAIDLFVLRGFDGRLVGVDLVVDLASYDEVGGIDGVLGVRAAGVAFALGLKGEVVGLMLVLFVLGSVGLKVSQGGGAFDFVSQRGKRDCDAQDGEHPGLSSFVHCVTSVRIVADQGWTYGEGCPSH